MKSRAAFHYGGFIRETKKNNNPVFCYNHVPVNLNLAGGEKEQWKTERMCRLFQAGQQRRHPSWILSDDTVLFRRSRGSHPYWIWMNGRITLETGGPRCCPTSDDAFGSRKAAQTALAQYVNTIIVLMEGGNNFLNVGGPLTTLTKLLSSHLFHRWALCRTFCHFFHVNHGLSCYPN